MIHAIIMVQQKNVVNTVVTNTMEDHLMELAQVVQLAAKSAQILEAPMFAIVENALLIIKKFLLTSV